MGLTAVEGQQHTFHILVLHATVRLQQSELCSRCTWHAPWTTVALVKFKGATGGLPSLQGSATAGCMPWYSWHSDPASLA